MISEFHNQIMNAPPQLILWRRGHRDRARYWVDCQFYFTSYQRSQQFQGSRNPCELLVGDRRHHHWGSSVRLAREQRSSLLLYRFLRFENSCP